MKGMADAPLALLPEIATDRCTGCGWCVAACPVDVLSLQPQGWRKHAVLHDAIACTGCRLCARLCPFGVIRMQPMPLPRAA